MATAGVTEFVWNGFAVGEKLDAVIQDGLTQLSVDANEVARSIAPVVTGYYQEHIGAFAYTEHGHGTMYLYATADYSSFLELGTSKMAPRRVLGRTIDAVLPHLPQYLADAASRQGLR